MVFDVGVVEGVDILVGFVLCGVVEYCVLEDEWVGGVDDYEFCDLVGVV